MRHYRIKNVGKKYEACGTIEFPLDEKWAISIIEASTVLRNQLLWYEHQKSSLPNDQWNSDFHTH